MTNDSFTNDSAYGGGAIEDDASVLASVTISNSSFTDDNAGDSGGGAVNVESGRPQ